MSPGFWARSASRRNSPPNGRPGSIASPTGCASSPPTPGPRSLVNARRTGRSFSASGTSSSSAAAPSSALRTSRRKSTSTWPRCGVARSAAARRSARLAHAVSTQPAPYIVCLHSPPAQESDAAAAAQDGGQPQSGPDSLFAPLQVGARPSRGASLILVCSLACVVLRQPPFSSL